MPPLCLLELQNSIKNRTQITQMKQICTDDKDINLHLQDKNSLCPF